MNLNFCSEFSESKNIDCKKCGKIPLNLFQCSKKHNFCKKCAFLNKLKCDLCFDHLKEDDTESLKDANVCCKSCGHRTKYSEMENHYEVCDKLEIECKQCKLGILRSELEVHQHHKCCIRWKVECPYGCDTRGLSEIELQNHRAEKYLYHEDIVYYVITHYGLDNILKIKDGNVKKTFPFFEKLMGDQINDIVEFKNLITEIKDLKHTIGLKRVEKEEQMRLLERSINMALLTSFNGTLLWILDQNLHDNSRRESPIFYTGKYGYKLQLIIIKNEDNQEIFLLFLEGMYDPILNDVFKTKVNVEIKQKNGEKISSNKDETFNKTNCEHLIQSISSDVVEWIKFEVDCSEFDFPSID